MQSSMNDVTAAKIIFKIFAIASLACYFYSLVTGFYSGDYLFQEVTLNVYTLSLNLLLNLLPYWILWKVYIRFKKNQSQKIKPFRITNIIGLITVILFLYTVLVTSIYGVGKMEADVYNAPSGIKVFIQIMNRISFLYVVLFFILVNRNFIMDLLAIGMVLIISYLTAGSGSILYLMFVFLIKYMSILKPLYKRFKYVIIISCFLIPSIVGQIYNLRDKLRDSESKELSTFDLMFGKLAGRLSSFPNSAVIIQEPIYFIISASSLDNFYFQIQSWKALFGGDYREKKPEYLMKGVFNDGDNGDSNSAFMSSTPGNMIISFLKSPINLIATIFTVILFVYLIFKMASHLNARYDIEYALVLVIYPITSGVASEYIQIITTLIFLLIINKLSKLFFVYNRDVSGV